MRSRRTGRQPHEKKPIWGAMFVCVFLFLAILMVGNMRNANFADRLKYRVSSAMLHDLSPVTAGNSTVEEVRRNGILSLVLSDFPISRYGFGNTSYKQSQESELEGDILAESSDENTEALEEGTDTPDSEETGNGLSEDSIMASHNVKVDNTWKLTDKINTYAVEKLQDFDYLKQNFYTIDRTTTIGSDELNVDKLLAVDCKLTHNADTPQILIYHTHSQEKYADSADVSEGVMGVGDYLTEILTEEYGLNVIHHKGEYDVESRDNAYSVAGPALEQLLADNPGIEVVIDLHRDGVADGTHLTTEVNGVTMAPIMFFNGLSRTTSTGAIDYLYNPYLSENLSFSFQLQLAANEYFPGLTRPIYLKGYRYNLHYCPKSLLVEVGAQTNTVQEAMNAMEPLAAVLNHVLTED